MNKKNLVIVMAIIIVGLVSFFYFNASKDNPVSNSKTKMDATTEMETKNSGMTERDKAVQKFLGKPTVIFIAGTYCSHCVSNMPKYKSEIWDNYKEQANIFVNVIDKKKFDVPEITQGFDEKLTFDILIGEKCNYVPSWIVLDKNGEVADKSCGTKKGVDEIKTILNKLLK